MKLDCFGILFADDFSYTDPGFRDRRSHSIEQTQLEQQELL
jgi:hypothetical protein